MSLRDEIAADIWSNDFMEDLFQEVELSGELVDCMVSVAQIGEAMDTPGGVVWSSDRDFRFRRNDLLDKGIKAKVGKTICYNGERYDINSVDARPDWPLVSVRGSLRM